MSLKVRGNSTLARLKANLKALPITVAHEVAASAAPGLTQRTRNAYDSGQTVYGEARPPGVNGPLTLEQSGATKKTLQFTSNGRIVRCVLGTPYAKYLIGRFSILPMGAMPAEWSTYLAGILERAKVKRYLRVGP